MEGFLEENQGQYHFGIDRPSSRQIRPNLYIIPSGCGWHDYNVNHFYDIDVNINVNINDLNHFNNVDNIDDNINDNNDYDDDDA